MKNILLTSCLLLLTISVYAQQITQTIRGKVVDAQSKFPLIGASVIIPGTSPLIGDATDENGEFRLSGVAIGRTTLAVSYIGYEKRGIANILVTSGKEVFLTIALEEKTSNASEVLILADRQTKASVNNEMATVSARSFSVEETSRYAGSRNDVARMATNFAGVSGANDARNDIVIRGNSPAGVLWRLDGINIPNPSHYGPLGATGGAVSMLNNNVLDKSDFLTAAFPAQYGNAVAGVFDLQLRSGNSEKREYLGQMGFNGFELGAEGPFRKNSKASYLVNYRYSTLGVFKALGMNFGTGSAVPIYQDLTYKVDIPTAKYGQFSFWGMGGKSSIDILGSELDTTGNNLTGTTDKNIFTDDYTGVAGFSHQYYFNSSTSYKISLAASSVGQRENLDSLSVHDKGAIFNERVKYLQNKYSAHLSLNKKIDAKKTLSKGIIVDVYGYDLKHAKLFSSPEQWRNIRNSKGYGTLVQSYTQFQNKFTDKLTLNSGLSFLYFSISQSYAVEPRLGLKYKTAPGQSLNFGYGLHSQIQPLTSYFIQTPVAEGANLLTNKKLGFTQSHHVVLGYDYLITPDVRLKIEAYYQGLRNVPVEKRSSSFSILNAAIEQENLITDSLTNKGTGRNYGLELTLEKFYSKGYYYLLTASLFDSKYKGSDGILRNTAYNGHYVVNLLAGKEFKVGQRNNINIDWKLTSAGGNYRIPINLDKSKASGTGIYELDAAYSEKLNNYFRTDLKLSYRINRPRFTHEIALDIQNLMNTKNVFIQRYNARRGGLETEYQLGIIPIPQYRVLF